MEIALHLWDWSASAESREQVLCKCMTSDLIVPSSATAYPTIDVVVGGVNDAEAQDLVRITYMLKSNRRHFS